MNLLLFIHSKNILDNSVCIENFTVTNKKLVNDNIIIY